MTRKTWTWQKFMTKWNREILESSWEHTASRDVLNKGWLGRNGASEEQLAELEARLKVKLPPSYRSFLSFTNGWEEGPIYFIGMS